MEKCVYCWQSMLNFEKVCQKLKKCLTLRKCAKRNKKMLRNKYLVYAKCCLSKCWNYNRQNSFWLFENISPTWETNVWCTQHETNAVFHMLFKLHLTKFYPAFWKHFHSNLGGRGVKAAPRTVHCCPKNITSQVSFKSAHVLYNTSLISSSRFQ